MEDRREYMEKQVARANKSRDRVAKLRQQVRDAERQHDDHYRAMFGSLHDGWGIALPQNERERYELRPPASDIPPHYSATDEPNISDVG